MKQISVALWLMLCLALPASAQMYKWVDANGRVQYSDKPPPGDVKSQKLHEPAPPAAGAPAAGDGKGEAKKDAAKAGPKTGPKTVAEQEQAFRKRQLEAAKAQEDVQKKQAEARDKEENCKRARAAVTNLQIGGRQMRTDEKGERVYLDEAQIAQEMARAQQVANATCN